MIKDNYEEFEIRIIPQSLNSLFNDDIEFQILSPLTCLREYETHWLLEFDLPLVNKKDIKITFDESAINIEAKLKEKYSEEKFGKKIEYEYFKKTITLPNKINNKKISATFENGRLKMIIPKKIFTHKIEIE